MAPQPPVQAVTGTASTGPVGLGPGALTALRPARRARITGGLWHERREVNARTSIPDGFTRLESAGNFHDLRLAAGTASGPYSGGLPFMDSDVHKWLEAAAWSQAEGAADGEPAKRLSSQVDQVISLLAQAQLPNGYLQSYFQVVRPDEHFDDLQWGHELYCAGHLIQAAVAHARTTGRTELLDIARRLADHIDRTFGPGRKDSVCGHPEIETALVELYRHTAEDRYLALARHFVDRRGHGSLGEGRFGSAYWQDHTPVRDARHVAGHAVRQLYLLAGVVDVGVETGDEELIASAERLWDDMVANKTYLTGGTGSHHTDEAFGDPYELPSERAYCETCAAIASVHFSWRLLLATGRARYADLIERTLYNGFLAGVSLTGDRYLYVNPLQVRDGHTGRSGDHTAVRTPWFHCACCPPNVMRLLASLQHYVAAGDGDGLVLHQYVPGEYAVAVGDGGTAAVRVTTSYPWHGTVGIEVTETGDEPWTLTVRLPHWSAGHRVTVDGEEQQALVDDGWLRITRTWKRGTTARLTLEMPPRITTADPRVDAVRGCVALERGPLVYCVEQADQAPEIRLDDLVADLTTPVTEDERPELLGGVITLTLPGRVRERTEHDRGWWPYGPPVADHRPPGVEAVRLTAVPYYAWGNRRPGAMRIWLPTR